MTLFDEEEANLDFSSLALKENFEQYPLWVCGDGRIFLETFSPFFKKAYDFCVTISEPISRPELIHEYQITPYSLYAAASVGLSSEDILNTLKKLSKNELSPQLKLRVIRETQKCGKVKLVLREGLYFLESPFENCLVELFGNVRIKEAAVKIEETWSKIGKESFDKHSSFLLKYNCDWYGGTNALIDSIDIYFFQISANNVESVKKVCHSEGFPLLEEYVLKPSPRNLGAKLKADTVIRPYQRKSLSRMLGSGRARSGIIVLPCGSGKTLVGIAAACAVGKSTIVLGTTGVSCQQWKNEFLKWSDISPDRVRLFIASSKEPIPPDEECVVVTTYSMMAFSQRRSRAAELMMQQIQNREWGLVILDEVHVAPAEMFRKCLSVTRSRCKLGLTATLVREDEKIEDLFFLIGPKLYEADWISLQKDRYLATVKCAEIWCPMDPLFLKEYLRANSQNRKMLLQTMNTTKFRTCQYLINKHEALGDKIMVFSDNIWSLRKYAVELQKPFIYGKTSEAERLATLDALQHSKDINTVFISKIGDCSIDLPDVNVVIQISSHFSSRRQEAQRLGRILRPKARSDSCAYFYSLVSRDTDESVYAPLRQKFLVDQGYSFKVSNNDENVIQSKELRFADEKSRKQLLSEVMASAESNGVVETDVDQMKVEKRKIGRKKSIHAEKIRKIKSRIMKYKRSKTIQY